MAGLFKRVPLVAIFGLAIGPVVFAQSADTARAGRSAMPDSRPSSYPIFESSQRTPPLRMALALSREKLPATPRVGEKLQDTSLRLAQQARTDGVPQQRTDAQEGNASLIWEIAPSDRTLNSTLSRWSASAGWQLVWDMEVDYPVETRAVLQGTFQEAVATVAQSLSGASVPVQATFYEGNKVLRIVAKGSK